MTDDEVWAAAVRWVKAITGRTTIASYQSGKGLALPYCMVNFTGSAEVRTHEAVVEYTETDTENSEGQLEIEAAPVVETEWRFSVHAYGLNPVNPATMEPRVPKPVAPTDVLRPLRSAAKLTQKWEPHFPNLTMHEVSQVRFVPDWIENAWQPRAQMDLIIRGFTRDGFVIDTIDEAPFTVERI